VHLCPAAVPAADLPCPAEVTPRTVLGLPSGALEELTSTLQTAVANMAGVPPDSLHHTATYGIRIYGPNSTLTPHVDRFDTHILSAVYCIKRKENTPPGPSWPMTLQPDFSGAETKVDLKQGQIFFYESAKLPHGRPTPLQAQYYAHIFVHFRPADWVYTRADQEHAFPSFAEVSHDQASVPALCLDLSWAFRARALLSEASAQSGYLRHDLQQISVNYKNAALTLVAVGIVIGQIFASVIRVAGKRRLLLILVAGFSVSMFGPRLSGLLLSPACDVAVEQAKQLSSDAAGKVADVCDFIGV